MIAINWNFNTILYYVLCVSKILIRYTTFNISVTFVFAEEDNFLPCFFRLLAGSKGKGLRDDSEDIN